MSPPGTVQQHRRMLIPTELQLRGCSSLCSAASGASGGELGLLITAQLLEQLALHRCLFPVLRSNCWLFPGVSLGDKWESSFPANAICRGSRRVHVLSRGKPAPGQLLHVLQTSLLHRVTVPHHVRFLLCECPWPHHPQASPCPASSLKTTFPYPLFPGFRTHCSDHGCF